MELTLTADLLLFRSPALMFGTWWREKGRTENVEHEFLHVQNLSRDIGLFFLSEMELSRLADATTTTIVPHDNSATSINSKCCMFFQ
jgi:hypothetical protein